MTASPRVAIIVLNYNGLHLTQDCLRSLQKVDYPNFRTIVLDNGSAQDESVPLRAEFGDTVDLIRSEEANGFCRGNNIGMRRALEQDFDYLVWLNNDTVVEPDVLRVMIDMMEADPRIGAAQPKIVHHDDPSKIDAAGGLVDLWTSRHKLIKKATAGPRTDLTMVHGAAFFVRRAVVEQVGFLDEDYYSYWEETDFCLRTRRAGWRLACNPNCVVHHKIGQTNRYLSTRYIYYMTRNGFLCMRKNARWYQWPTFTLGFLGSSVIKYFAFLLLTRPRDARRVFDAIGDFLGGRLGRRDF